MIRAIFNSISRIQSQQQRNYHFYQQQISAIGRDYNVASTNFLISYFSTASDEKFYQDNSLLLTQSVALIKSIDNRIFISSNLRRKTKNRDEILFKKNKESSLSELVNEFILLYFKLNTNEKQQLIQIIVEKYGYNQESTLSKVTSIVEIASYSNTTATETLIKQLRDATTPNYQILFQNILSCRSMLVIPFFIDLRAHSRNFKLLQNDLKQMLTYIFIPSILSLEQITFEKTSASVIEQVAKQEAVHPFQSFEDLRKRLSHHYCYAFFHPSLPMKPLVFVYVALCHIIPSSMEQVHQDKELFQKKNVAVFYSITQTQTGLKGIHLGHLLIKRVVDQLRLLEQEKIDTFVTLSPMPHFRHFVKKELLNGKSQLLLSNEQQTYLTKSANNDFTLHQQLWFILNETQWYHDNELSNDVLKPILTRCAIQYLLKEKHHGKPIDPVQKFHCSNGAYLYSINFCADLSRKGLHTSFGMMVNYYYDLKEIESNSIDYEVDGSVAIGERVKELIDEVHLK